MPAFFKHRNRDLEAQAHAISMQEGEQVKIVEDDFENEVNKNSPLLFNAQKEVGYKVEHKAIVAERNANISKIKLELKENVAKIKQSEDADKDSKIKDLELRFTNSLAKIVKDYEAKEKKLLSKYEDEIKYHINPKLSRKEKLLNSDILLSVRHLKQFFFFGSKIHNMKLKAVSNVSFDVHKGECFGIVGESGCGKTTTGRTIIKLYKPTSGSIYYKGYRIGAGARWNQKEIKWVKKRKPIHIKEFAKERDDAIAALDPNDANYQIKLSEINTTYQQKVIKEKQYVRDVVKVQKKKIRQISFDQRHCPRKLMSEVQMIFQDPVDSLDPRMTVEDIIQEGLRIQGFKNKKQNHAKVKEMLEKVGLVEEHASRYPHEFSGGQRQRIGIARALVMNPKLLICDEPISALDVSIRAQVINLLNDLKDEMGLTLIFIAHDLSVVKYFCDRIAVMYFGKLVELATSEELFKHPLHPYTRALLSAIPKPNPLTERNRIRIVYNPATAHDYSKDLPDLKEVCPGHLVYCNGKEFEEYSKIVNGDNEPKKTSSPKPAEEKPAPSKGKKK